MALIVWDASLMLGIRQIDQEHRKLVDMVNRLHQGVQGGKGREALGTILNELVAYTKTHFESEERLMKQHQYPGYLNHKKEHTALMFDVMEAMKLYQGNYAALPTSMLQFLVDWLTVHIKKADRDAAVFLKGRGVV